MKRSRGVVAGLAAFVLLALAAPAANAVVVQLPNGQFAGVYLRAGLSAAAFERQTGARPLERTSRPHVATTDPNGLFYNGGPVLHTTKPYLVFWDPPNSTGISATSRHVMTQYYTDAAVDASHPADVYAYRVLQQYTDSGGSAAQGQTFSAAQAISDIQAYPTVDSSVCTSTNQSGFAACITDAQIRAELTRLINADSLPTGIGANAPIYFVVTPANVDVCDAAADCSGGPNGAFCAYHSAYTGPGSSTVIYSSIPFTQGAACQSAGVSPTQEPSGDVADVITDNMSHENAEAVTDPLGNAWLTSNGEEVADQCEAWGPTPDPNDPAGPSSPDAYTPTLGGSQQNGTLYDQLINGDHYFTQTLWSNSNDNCVATSPSASFTSPATVLTGVSASFDPGPSSTANGYASTTWNWGDGSPNTVVAGAPAATSHTYVSPGTYTVTLTVVDGSGYTNQVSRTVAVYTPLTAAFSPSGSTVETGSPVAFNGAGSSDPNAGQSIAGYSWSFGDGSPGGTGVAPSHSYSAPGIYTVTLTVAGSEGLTSTVSHSITVVAAPVAVPALGTAHPVSGWPVSFNGGSSTGAITTYAWNFGDGATSSATSPSHIYARAGAYTVTLTVTDASGFTSTRSLTVLIAKSPIASVSTKHVNGAYYLVVSVTQAGTVKFGSSKVAVKHPGKATFKIPLSAAQRQRLRHGKTVSLNVTIAFTPKHGPQIRRVAMVTLRQ